MDFARDQTLDVIESTTGVDLESFAAFLNNEGSNETPLTIDEGKFEGDQITLFLSTPLSDSMPSKNDLMSSLSTRNKKLLASQLSKKIE